MPSWQWQGQGHHHEGSWWWAYGPYSLYQMLTLGAAVVGAITTPSAGNSTGQAPEQAR